MIRIHAEGFDIVPSRAHRNAFVVVMPGREPELGRDRCGSYDIGVVAGSFPSVDSAKGWIAGYNRSADRVLAQLAAEDAERLRMEAAALDAGRHLAPLE